MKFDDKDLKVLELLRENSKLTTGQMSKKLRMPATTIHNRIRKLEKEGVIKNYTIVQDYKKLGKEILAYVLVTVTYMLPSGEKVSQEKVAREIKYLGVEEVCIVAGGTDIVIKVRAKDVDELNNFVVKKLRSVEGVDKTQTLIALSVF